MLFDFEFKRKPQYHSELLSIYLTFDCMFICLPRYV